MIVKKTEFTKEGMNFHVMTRKISNGFITSCTGKDDVFSDSEDEALHVHEELEDALEGEKKESITNQIEKHEENLKRLKTIDENINEWISEAKEEAEKSYQRYKERQEVINN